MNKFLSTLSKSCKISATLLLLAFVVLPIKVMVVLTITYLIAHSAGAFKLKFPDVWELEENEDDIEKPHRVFLTVPTSIDGRWYIFCYMNKTVTDGVTSFSLNIN